MLRFNVVRPVYRKDGDWDKVYREGSILSADDKPVMDDMSNGSILLEMDTSTVYMWDEENQEWRAW